MSTQYYNGIKCHKNRREAINILKNYLRCRGIDPDEKAITPKKFLKEFKFTSPYGDSYIDMSMQIGFFYAPYIQKDNIKVISIFDIMNFGKDFNPATLFDLVPDADIKNISFIYLLVVLYNLVNTKYAFALEAMQKWLTTIKESEKEPRIILGYPNSKDISDDMRCIMNLIIINLSEVDKDKKVTYQVYVNRYIKALNSSNIFTELIYSNKELYTMHKYVYKNFDTLQKNILNNDNVSLDLIESKPEAMDEFLRSVDSYYYKYDDIYKKHINEIKNDPERFIEVINNYLYSNYKSSKNNYSLKSVLKKIYNFINKTEIDCTLIDIIEGLPENISAAALQIMVE